MSDFEQGQRAQVRQEDGTNRPARFEGDARDDQSANSGDDFVIVDGRRRDAAWVTYDGEDSAVKVAQFRIRPA